MSGSPSAALSTYESRASRPGTPHANATLIRRLTRDRASIVAIGILAIVIGGALAAPVLSRHDPLRGVVGDRLLPPGTPGHLIGTDEQGRDLFARLLHGGRVSLMTGIAPVVLATIAGTLIGAIAAYTGRAAGTILMRLMDVSYAFPAIVLSIAITASLGPGTLSAIIALTVVFVPPISRVAEAAVCRVMFHEYVDAARAIGASPLRVLTRHVLPNIAGTVLVYACGLVGLSIMVASGLSFLGLGPPPPTPEWGVMLNSLRGSLYVQPVLAAIPGAFIFLTSLAFNLLSDGLRDALDMRRA